MLKYANVDGVWPNHTSTKTYSVVPTTYFKLLILAVGPEAQSGPWARLKRSLHKLFYSIYRNAVFF